VDRVVARRAHSAKAARIDGCHREIYGFENAPRGRRGGIPRSTAGHGIGVQPAASLLGDYSDGANVGGIVRQLELLDRGVPSLHVLDFVKEPGILT